MNTVSALLTSTILPECVAQVFYVLEPEHEKRHITPRKQRIFGVDDVTDEEEYNHFDDVPFFVDAKNINLLKTRISYSTMLPYSCTDANDKIVQG
jgi:hypothetical protein